MDDSLCPACQLREIANRLSEEAGESEKWADPPPSPPPEPADHRYKRKPNEGRRQSENLNRAARSLQERLCEPDSLRPVLRKALLELGEDHVNYLVFRAEKEWGLEFTPAGFLRTVGGIFLKYLKLHPQRARIFRKKSA